MTIASKIKDLNIYSSIFRLFALGIPFYLFIIYLIMYEIKLINGIYLIHLKITYLSICMAEIIIRNYSYQSEIVIFFEHFFAILYRSDAGIDGYSIPMTNITQYDINTPLAIGSSWIDTYNEHFADTSGDLEYISFNNNSLYDYAPFQNWLLNNYDNAFWTSEGFTNPLDNSIIPINNTIQAGINLTAVHVLPVVYNFINNWIVKDLVNSEALIELSSYPLPVTSNEKVISDSFSGIFASIYLMIAFAFIPVGAVYNIVMDKTKLTKHQQLVSGISFISYWCGNFVADFIAAIPAMLIVYILIHAFNVDVYLGAAQGPFLLVLIVFT